MSLTLVTQPAAYPITLAEAKQQSHLEHNDDDAFVAACIAAATNYAETYTGRDLIQRTWDYSFDAFPSGSKAIVLPRYPVLSITSLKYLNYSASPNTQTVATTVYALDHRNGYAEIYLQYDQNWPTDNSTTRNAVTARFVSGYVGLGSPEDLRFYIPETLKFAIRLIVGDLYEHREARMDMQTYQNDTVMDLLNMHRLHRL